MLIIHVVNCDDDDVKDTFLHVYIKVSYADCREIVSACKSSNVMLTVCHVLRYLPEVRKITELIQSGVLGDVVCIQHTEPVCHALTCRL